MQESVRILMRRDDMLETFSELAVKEPDLMRLVLQACVAAMVNVQCPYFWAKLKPQTTQRVP